MKKLIPVALICLLIDQVLKIIICVNMNITDSINIISNFFRITYLQNTGAAWSIFSDNTILLIIITFVALSIIYLFLIKNKKLKNYEYVLYGILIGGILGNLIDRIRYGYVIDYLDFNFGKYHYPVFNFADICIVISIIIMVLIGLKEDKNGNSSR